MTDAGSSLSEQRENRLSEVRERGFGRAVQHGVSATAVLAAIPLFAMADVRYEQSVSVTAGGALSSFSSEIKVLTEISGDRSRREVLPANEMAADMAVNTIGLVRLDQDTTYQLNPDNKTYKEVSLEELRRELGSLRERMDASTGGQTLPVATENCEWSAAKFSTRKTKEKARYAGLRATRHIISMKQSCTDASSGMSCDMEWTLEPWMASRVTNSDEVQEFYQVLADKLSMDYLIPQMPGASQMMLGLFPNRWESLLDEMEEFKGYPVRTDMTFKIGGDLCTTAAGVPVAQDGLWSNVGTSAYNEAIKRSGRETGSAVGAATREAMGDSVGGAVGSSAIGAATGELVGGLADMFKADKPKRTTSTRAAAPPDKVTVFRIQSEITDWSKKKVPAERYEIPEGWSKQN